MTGCLSVNLVILECPVAFSNGEVVGVRVILTPQFTCCSITQQVTHRESSLRYLFLTPISEDREKDVWRVYCRDVGCRGVYIHRTARSGMASLTYIPHQGTVWYPL